MAVDIGYDSLNKVIGSHPSVNYAFVSGDKLLAKKILNMTDVTTIKSQLEAPGLVVYWDQIPDLLNAHFRYVDGLLDAQDFLACFYAVLDKQYFATNYKSVFVVSGTPAGLLVVAQHFRRYMRQCDIVPPDARNLFLDDQYTIPRVFPASTKIVPLFKVEPAYVHSFFQDSNVSFDSKVLSSFFNNFPSTRDKFINKYTIYPYHCPASAPTTYISSPEVESILMVSVASLCTAYSQRSRITQQIGKRITAMLAGSNYPSIRVDSINDALTAIDWKPEEQPPAIVEAIGWVCAINKDGIIDPVTSINDLMDPDEWAARYHVPDWVKFLFVQMRLVYSHFQCSSINFALVILPLIESLTTPGTSYWKKDIDALNEIKNIIIDCPYSNCMFTIPEKRRISAFPRLVYMGTHYHAKHLSDEKDKEDFKFYVTEGTVHHFKEKKDQELCRLQVQSLPRPTVSALAILGSATPAEKMEEIVSGYDNILQAAIYQEMKRNYPQAPWVTYKHEKYKRAEVARMRTSLLNIIDQKYQDAITYLNELYMGAQNDETRIQLKTKKDDFMKTVLGLKAKLTTLKEEMAIPENPEFEVEREKLIDLAKPILDAINAIIM